MAAIYWPCSLCLSHYFPLQFRKPLAYKHKSGITKGMYCRCRRTKKKKRRTHIQLKNICFWSQMTAVSNVPKAPTRSFSLSTFTPQRALLKLETSNMTESLLLMGYCLMKLTVIVTIGDRQSQTFLVNGIHLLLFVGHS